MVTWQKEVLRLMLLCYTPNNRDLSTKLFLAVNVVKLHSQALKPNFQTIHWKTEPHQPAQTTHSPHSRKVRLRPGFSHVTDDRERECELQRTPMNGIEAADLRRDNDRSLCYLFLSLDWWKMFSSEDECEIIN